MKEKANSETLHTFNVDGSKYKTRISRKYLERKPYEPSDPKKIIAFIPGNIKTVFIHEGSEVTKGEILLTLEAMKMNNCVVSSCDGTVKKIYVKQGENVTNKQLLVELE